jgi:kynureninase
MNNQLLPDMVSLIGAKCEEEVALTASLTTNLHNLMISFYRPAERRYKIITDANSFPSDKVHLPSDNLCSGAIIVFGSML